MEEEMKMLLSSIRIRVREIFIISNKSYEVFGSDDRNVRQKIV